MTRLDLARPERRATKRETKMGMPPPPQQKRMQAPPPPPKIGERECQALFVRGEFERIPKRELAELYGLCREMGKPDKMRVLVGELDYFGAVFSYSTFPIVSWEDAKIELENKVMMKSPFCALSVDCIKWLEKECDYNFKIDEIEKKDNVQH